MSDDLISRQAALKTLTQLRLETMLKHEDVSKIWECEDAIVQCPSVQPEQKNCCPNCGAKMEGNVCKEQSEE